MKKSLTYIAIDVDDTAYHFSVLNTETGEVLSHKCRPTANHFIKKLKQVTDSSKTLKICYESTYLGFSLCRNLRSKGFDCEVIASSLIPEYSGKRIKTDRIDSEKLVLFYSQGLLTQVNLPDEREENIRDLIRSRNFLVKETKSIKIHILAICRRSDWNYKQESELNSPTYWTQIHNQWLVRKINSCDSPELKFNLRHLLTTLEHHKNQISNYDMEIERISETKEYVDKARALKSFRGIRTNTAMTLITEIGDINRFSHPAKLTSYCGMDISEYSSGGKERKAGITKLGNSFIRTSVVEACQTATKTPHISRRLTIERVGQAPEITAIADRCMERLYKKGNNLKYKNKAPNKIKIACGREMLGFIWEALRTVS